MATMVRAQDESTIERLISGSGSLFSDRDHGQGLAARLRAAIRQRMLAAAAAGPAR